jgi:uncharacterized membrane protein YkvA (DUF1232 family)
MFCTNCGAHLGNVNFCPRCGTAVQRDYEEPASRARHDPPEDQYSVHSEQEPRSRGFGNAKRKAEDYVRDPQRTQELLSSALKKASSRRSDPKLTDEIWDYLQTAVRLVQATVRGEYTGLSRKNLTLIIAAILYYISPIDLIPDIFPIAGLFDDVGVLAFALRSLKTEIETFKEWERSRGVAR